MNDADSLRRTLKKLANAREELTCTRSENGKLAARLAEVEAANAALAKDVGNLAKECSWQVGMRQTADARADRVTEDLACMKVERDGAITRGKMVLEHGRKMEVKAYDRATEDERASISSWYLEQHRSGSLAHGVTAEEGAALINSGRYKSSPGVVSGEAASGVNASSSPPRGEVAEGAAGQGLGKALPRGEETP